MTGPNASLEIETIYGNCPVQAEGRIAGRPFYFRARCEGWSFSVGEEPVGNPDWGHYADYDGEPFAAGWIDDDEARAFIEEAAALYRASPEADTSTQEPEKP